MIKSRQHILTKFKSRFALNVYFWVFYWLLEFVLNAYGRRMHYYYPYSQYFFIQLTTTILFMAVVYINNLWLMPQYFVKKRYGRYILLLLPVTYIAGICFSGITEWMDIRFPKMNMEDVFLFLSMRVNYPTRWLIFLEAISWMTTLFILIVMFNIAWYMQDYNRQKRKTQEAEKKQIEAELKFLKSQINPHFLFNTLNNLYTLTIIKSDTAPEVVSKLSTILRYLLYESNVKEVSFEKEKEIMQAYIDLELLRISQTGNLHFSITADRPYKLPPLLWIPILENAFKHGTRFISKEYYIDYQFDIRDGKLSIISKNSYKPDTGNKLENTGGIGLNNLKKRLALLYPERHSINTSTADNLYITQINVDLYESINSR